MNTRLRIKQAALKLFNKEGIMNITLRAIAKELNKSYGNVTYHYKTKNELVMSLYLDMMEKMAGLQLLFNPETLFEDVLKAPSATFKISIKYSFLYTDYVEIKRNFPSIAARLGEDAAKRKVNYSSILKELQQQGYLRSDLQQQELDYLMDLSGIVRTFYFLDLSPQDFHQDNIEHDYLHQVNQLIFPYLTEKGIIAYRKAGF